MSVQQQRISPEEVLRLARAALGAWQRGNPQATFEHLMTLSRGIGDEKAMQMVVEPGTVEQGFSRLFFNAWTLNEPHTPEQARTLAWPGAMAEANGIVRHVNRWTSTQWAAYYEEVNRAKKRISDANNLLREVERSEARMRHAARRLSQEEYEKAVEEHEATRQKYEEVCEGLTHYTVATQKP